MRGILQIFKGKKSKNDMVFAILVLSVATIKFDFQIVWSRSLASSQYFLHMLLRISKLKPQSNKNFC
jgi:hypothetical protein